ncbi:MAG: TldD/PmbA family protein, partial [Candidatus Heimdallarchaeota archaeon]|nr:TldD/PmbA family protein [Candidatus Heimdallarchaeota archaeon]MCK5049277.1 TldD/PmbA family protein [Candidatus Heimdallarchaeota archaeon]
DLLSRIDRGLKYSQSKGAEAAEIYMINTDALSINMMAGIIEAKQGGQIGIGVRCIVDGSKMGFASSSGITDEFVNFAVDAAISAAKSSTTDDRWQNFVQSSEVGKEGILDASVLELTSEEAVNGATTIFKEAKEYDPRIVSVTGSIDVDYGAYGIGNTEGIAKSTAYTTGVSTVQITAVEDGKTKTSFDFSMGRGAPVFEGLGTSGGAKVIKLLGATSLGKTGQMPTIFNPLAAGQIIQTGLINSVNGKSVVEGRSAFADKIGAEVGVPFLTIKDDGQIPEDPNMVAIDDEGYARQTTNLIENGVLKSFIFNNYYSKIFEAGNTGNAQRGGPQSYETMPGVSPTTIAVDAGSKDLQALAEEIGNGVLVTDFLMGMMHSNVVSGDFSIVAPSSFKVENGEIAGPIEAVTVAGNLYKAFKQIISLGNETDLTFFGKVPSISFDGFTVSG